MAICPACGKENPDQFRLCGFCGSPLRGTAGARVEERKIVSVLFVDLVGFTARSHSADPEDVRAALRPYHERLKREIERFGGTVEKFIGDAVMAVFGAPVTHEDDSERAVRAALRINEAIAELNETTPGLDLSLRTAVNTGEGLVSLGARPEAGEGMVTGDVVNTASRLESIAPVNGVVVGEQTYRSTKEVIDYEDLRPVRVKGKPDPVPVWRALSAKSRFEADVEAAYATPFIGREDELELLKRSYSRSVREPSVQLVTITGEPGVGKSRLLAEFFSVVDKEQGSTLRQGRCLPYGEGITFWALGEVVKAQAGILQSDSADEAGAKLATALGAVIDDPTERPWFQARLGALVGAAAPAGVASKEESFAAWRRFLEAVATTGPFVVAIEDLHWADPSLLEFIEHLVEWTTGVPLLVMTTARPELYDKHPSWAGGIRNAATISLSPLSKEKTSELVSALLSTAVLPSEMHAALIDRAGGNPLYAEEFVHMLTDRGMLERRGPVVSLPNGGNIPLPDSVQALIAARLDTLSPEHKALLQDAAVAGNVFWAGAVAAMQRVSQEAVIEKLHHLTRKEIVRPVRISSIGNEREYSFWHALIRDVSYAQIPRAVRAAKHQAMAAWIERRAETRIADHAEILAHHYSQALRLARAAGDPAAGSLEEPARSHLVAAGDRAAELDLAAAVAYYIRALDLFPAGHPERAEALTKAGVAARNAGHLDDAAGLLEEAINEARHAGDERTEGGAMVQLAGVEWYRGKTQRSIAISAAAVELLEGEHVGPELAFAYDRLATAAGFSGDSARALELNDKAMAIARTSGDQRLLVRVGTTRGDTLCALGDLSGLDDLRRAVKQALDLELSGPATYAYSALCEWVWLEEGPAAGREAYAEAIEFLTKRGMMTFAGFAQAEALRVLFDLGRWHELNAQAQELLSKSDLIPYVEVITLTSQAGVLVTQGQLARAEELIERLMPIARSIKDLQVLAPALALGSSLELALGNKAGAVALTDELEELTRGTMWRPRNLPEVARTLVAAAAVDKAQAMLSDLSATATRDRNSVLHTEAIVAEARNELDRALPLYDDAARRWSNFGFPLEKGHALFGAARCLTLLNRREKALRTFEKARRIFAKLGASPLVAEVDDHLPESTTGSR